MPFTQYIQRPVVTDWNMQTALAIPDGHTALLSGGKMVGVVRNECDPPILSKVPYVNRLFKNVGAAEEIEHVLVLVTPRIIVHEAEERAESGALIGATTGALIGHGSNSQRPELARPARVQVKEGPSGSILLGVGVNTDAGLTGSIAGTEKKVRKLLDKYDQACAQGRLEEAKKLARRALNLDPACFSRQRQETAGPTGR
jgi:hypothetical protein